MRNHRPNLRLSVFLAVLAFTGCAARQKTVTNLPAGVTQAQAQSWDTAVANLDKIAQTTSTLRQAVIALNGATVTDAQGAHKVIPDGATYAAILTSIGKIDQAQLDAVQYLRAQPQNWGISTQTRIKNDVTLIQAELLNITGQQLAGIKNTASQQQVSALISVIGNAATVILSLIG
jgi:hypothetical protein